jgi:uncharacterized LabA/DUF88 family protein
MTAQFSRAPHQGRPALPTQQAPHAALLIDFDNVTMGIRSDITKELKNLLNSDIIKGKVAVQRAYADWRRYPQYVVPLAEGSVDLIFAPAYGSSKKNATDIRLSIDALELVFTRPEIGTFILLSGDSDFSSLVLKLKEYGKYVIGVGIRESASDLLVQNCDEYYSYSALTGLTRAGEEEPARVADPWELVEIGVQQMVTNGDVMRSDRLKQVLLDLDPNFDEKTLGFSKFNRFVAEAANRGVIRIHKLENGQFELAPADAAAPVAAAEEIVVEPRRGRRRRGDGDGREPRTEREAEPRAERAEHAAEPARPSEPQPERAPRGLPAPQRTEAPRDSSPEAMRAAYELLRKATTELGASQERAVRDSDVKRRMRDMEPNWDESSLGFSKFSRFLRNAHDAEVINLRKIENGSYEVALHTASPRPAAAQPAEAIPAGPTAKEPRPRRGRSQKEPRPAPEPKALPGDATERPPAATPAAKPAAKVEERAVAAPAPPHAPAAPTASQPVAGAIGVRRGSRNPRLTAPPPLLAGQTVPVQHVLPLTSAGASPAPPPGAAANRSAARDAHLPTDRDAVIDYLMRSFRGVGKKTAETLVDAVGADRVFTTLRDSPALVKQVLGDKRGGALIDAWQANANAAAAPANSAPSAGAPGDAGESAGSGRSGRGRRGGRRRGGRGRKRVPATDG